MEVNDPTWREQARERPALYFGDNRTPGMSYALSTLALESAFEDLELRIEPEATYRFLNLRPRETMILAALRWVCSRFEQTNDGLTLQFDSQVMHVDQAPGYHDLVGRMRDLALWRFPARVTLGSEGLSSQHRYPSGPADFLREMQAHYRTAFGLIHSTGEMAFQLANTGPQDFHILVNGWRASLPGIVGKAFRDAFGRGRRSQPLAAVVLLQLENPAFGGCTRDECIDPRAYQLVTDTLKSCPLNA